MKWFKVDFNDEKEGFERICKQLSAGQTQGQYEKNWATLKTLYKNSSMIDLKPSVWAGLGNTDSNRKMTMTDIQRAISNNKASSGNRQIYPVLAECLNNARAPIILSYRNRFTLVAGNTRLMACRLLEITPKVVVMTWR